MVILPLTVGNNFLLINGLAILTNKMGNVSINVTLTCIHATTVAVEKQ
jgi:hypothetical protein